MEQGNSKNYDDQSVIETHGVNIRRFVQDKSKIRSEFMQRFGSSAAAVTQSQKHQVIPQLLNHKPNQSAITSNDSAVSSRAAASTLAFRLTEPFLKQQNELETKMNCVLSQLSEMKDTVNHTDSINKSKIDNDLNYLNNMKLNYIEKLQDNQV